MNTEIVCEKARIVEVAHKIAGAVVTSRMKVVAIATARIAKAVGAPWLLGKEALVKQGFTSVDLEFLLKNARVKHGIGASGASLASGGKTIASLEIVSELVNKFKVFRKGDDNKKSKRLMVSFVVHHAGSPFEMLEHLMKVGSGEGTCTLVPLQAELFVGGDAKPQPKPKANGKQLPLHAPKAAKKKSASVARADAKKTARGTKLADKDGAFRRVARKKAAMPKVDEFGEVFDGLASSPPGDARGVVPGMTSTRRKPDGGRNRRRPHEARAPAAARTRRPARISDEVGEEELARLDLVVRDRSLDYFRDPSQGGDVELRTVLGRGDLVFCARGSAVVRVVTPAETAGQIVAAHLPDAPEGQRCALIEAIRWAIVQGQIEARQPLELPASQAGTIVYQILYFVDEWMDRLRGGGYVEQMRALMACRKRVLEIAGIAAVDGKRKPCGVAKELRVVAKA